MNRRQPDFEAELERARALDVSTLAAAIQTIGFECTRCGACCKAAEPAAPAGGTADETGTEDEGEAEDEKPQREPHTATVFPDEVRRLRAAGESGDRDDSDESDVDAAGIEDRDENGRSQAYDWRDVARPMPYGLADDGTGETFEWALQIDDCGDCAFYEEADDEDETGDPVGVCTVHEDRPLICRTYPFSVALDGTTQPMGAAVDREGVVRAHECEGLGREISRADARDLARALKRRTIRELEEAIAVRDRYAPVDAAADTVVHDSEGAKRPDGTPIDRTDDG